MYRGRFNGWKYNFDKDNDSIKFDFPSEIPLNKYIKWNGRVGYFCVDRDLDICFNSDFEISNSIINIGNQYTWSDGNTYVFIYIN